MEEENAGEGGARSGDDVIELSGAGKTSFLNSIYNRWIGLALQRSSHLSFARGSGSMAKNLIP